MIPRHLNRPIRFTKCLAREDEEKVQSGLSNTPAEMYDLAKQGRPIKSQVLSDDNFDDGAPMCSNEVPIIFQRGIDVNQAWEISKDAKNKFNSFTKQNKAQSQAKKGGE